MVANKTAGKTATTGGVPELKSGDIMPRNHGRRFVYAGMSIEAETISEAWEACRAVHNAVDAIVDAHELTKTERAGLYVGMAYKLRYNWEQYSAHGHVMSDFATMTIMQARQIVAMAWKETTTDGGGIYTGLTSDISSQMAHRARKFIASRG